MQLAGRCFRMATTGDGRDSACEIYTDVDGIYTTDPRIVPEARKNGLHQL